MSIDLEDDITRVRWMGAMAWEQLCAMRPGDTGSDHTKLCHLVRATAELSEGLMGKFLESKAR